MVVASWLLPWHPFPGISLVPLTTRACSQAVLVLVFMVVASWRLTTITFILIPLIMAISKVYGTYYSAMIKKSRTELAEANAVAEEVLGSMATIKVGGCGR